MKPIIICIVGLSGSGKTTASIILGEHFGWMPIVSYTTRPMRTGEIDGVEHWFVTPQQKPNKTKICAYTQFGGYEYWTTWDQFLSLFPNTYVIDEKGLIDLMSCESSPFPFKLITVRIEREDLSGIDEKRKTRDTERIYLPDEMFDYVIHNDGSVERFKEKIYRMAFDIIKNTQL